MNNVNSHRRKYEYSAAKLRRARRLYFKIVSKHVPDGEEGVATVRDMAARLQERGFYSKNTPVGDICFRCYRQMYKYTSDKWEGWTDWRMRRGYGQYPWVRNVA